MNYDDYNATREAPVATDRAAQRRARSAARRVEEVEQSTGPLDFSAEEWPAVTERLVRLDDTQLAHVRSTRSIASMLA